MAALDRRKLAAFGLIGAAAAGGLLLARLLSSRPSPEPLPPKYEYSANVLNVQYDMASGILAYRVAANIIKDGMMLVVGIPAQFYVDGGLVGATTLPTGESDYATYAPTGIGSHDTHFTTESVVLPDGFAVPSMKSNILSFNVDFPVLPPVPIEPPPEEPVPSPPEIPSPPPPEEPIPPPRLPVAEIVFGDSWLRFYDLRKVRIGDDHLALALDAEAFFGKDVSQFSVIAERLPNGSLTRTFTLTPERNAIKLILVEGQYRRSTIIDPIKIGAYVPKWRTWDVPLIAVEEKIDFRIHDAVITEFRSYPGGPRQYLYEWQIDYDNFPVKDYALPYVSLPDHGKVYLKRAGGTILAYATPLIVYPGTTQAFRLVRDNRIYDYAVLVKLHIGYSQVASLLGLF